MSDEDAPRAGAGPRQRGSVVGPAIRWALAAVALLGLALLWRALPASDWVERHVLPRVEGAGARGYLGFAALYVAAVVLMVPGTALTLAGGYLFGPVAGAAVSVLSATAGAAVAFLIARGLARDRIRHRVEADRRLRAVDRAVADRGGRVVLLLRLTPLVPFNLLNYALGLTSVRFGTYTLATLVGMVPGTSAVAVVGASGGERWPGDLGWGRWAALVAATLLAVVLIGRLAGRALARAGVAPDDDPDPGADAPDAPDAPPAGDWQR